jgi:glycerophosphoryl diester phosphodiesterase
MKLIAHGGYSSRYPENTYNSYVKALEFSPDGIEMDVVYYKGDFYCYHPVNNMTSKMIL